MSQELDYGETIATRSEEVQEVIGKPPHWLIRWGLIVFWTILIVIVVLSWLIKYPDTIKVPLKIISQDSAVSVASKIESNIFKIAIKDNQIVKRKQILVFLRNDTISRKVMALSNKLDTLYNLVNDGNIKLISDKFPVGFNNLEELQLPYELLYREYLKMKNSSLNNLISSSKQILPRKSKASSRVDERVKSQLAMESEKISFFQALNTLIEKIKIWKDDFILTSPITGRATFTGPLADGQVVGKQQELFYIIPDHAKCHGIINIPQNALGSFNIGQKVTMRLDNFPYREYGSINGMVEYISHVPQRDGIYIAYISLNEGLVTSHHDSLPFHNNMIGIAEIKTNKIRLAQRIWRSIFKQLKP